MVKNEKIARNIVLPIYSGKPAKLINEGGDTVKTSTCEIENITYALNGYFATISTRNSIYKDVCISDLPNEGNAIEVLKKGEYIKDINGELIKVGRILSITKDGITVEEETTGKVYTGFVK